MLPQLWKRKKMIKAFHGVLFYFILDRLDWASDFVLYFILFRKKEKGHQRVLQCIQQGKELGKAAFHLQRLQVQWLAYSERKEASNFFSWIFYILT